MATLCKACGKKVVWAVDTHGRNVALDPAYRVFEVLETIDNRRLPVASLKSKAYIKHANVCQQQKNPDIKTVETVGDTTP